MAQSWNSTANRRHLPSNTSRNNAEPEKNDALLPRRFTKAAIGVLVVSGVVVVGLQVSKCLIIQFPCVLILELLIWFQSLTSFTTSRKCTMATVFPVQATAVPGMFCTRPWP